MTGDWKIRKEVLKNSDISVRFYHHNKQSKISVVYNNKYSFPKPWCLTTTNIYFSFMHLRVNGGLVFTQLGLAD